MYLSDPAFVLMWLHARLRRLEQGLGAGPKKKAVGMIGRFSRRLDSALIKLSLPGAKSPWLTDEEAREANRERDDLLAALSGRARFAARGSKPHLGSLSPGCAICKDGYWGCNYINRRCHRSCFYCLRDHSLKKAEADSRSDGFRFGSPAEHINFIRAFRVRGVGFSGGEPLLALDRLLSHLAAIRREFGGAIHLWMYTNGDLVDRDTLQRLRAAGLDEVRFDLSARGYDLSPVKLARECIPMVTVEIPAIPGDFPRLKELLPELQAAGVDHLNLHQLFGGRRNWKALLGRGYHFSSRVFAAVPESELCALRLLRHASERNLHLPINYCSLAYKRRFQKRGLRLRSALASLEGHQEITDAGYIRSLRLSDSPVRIEALKRRLEAEPLDAGLWRSDEKQAELALHGSLMPYVDWSSARLTISYFLSRVVLKSKAGTFEPGNLKVDLRPVKTVTGLDKEGFECWRRLYVLKEAHGVGPGVWGKDPLTARDQWRLGDLAVYEELETGLPEFL